MIILNIVAQPHLPIPSGSNTHSGSHRLVVAQSQLQCPLHLLNTVEILSRQVRTKSKLLPLSHLHNDQFNVVFNEDLEALSQLLLDFLPALAFLICPSLDNAPRQDCSPPPRDPLGDVTAGLVDLPTLGRTI